MVFGLRHKKMRSMSPVKFFLETGPWRFYLMTSLKAEENRPLAISSCGPCQMIMQKNMPSYPMPQFTALLTRESHHMLG